MKIAKTNFVLRTWQEDDYPSLARYANNINIWNNVRDAFPHPYTEDDAKAYIKYVTAMPFTENMTIEVNGEACGGIGFIPLSDVERFSAELGYWIGEPYWGRGIVSDAVSAFIHYVFTETEIIRLFASVFEYNPASMKVLEKNGFRKVGIMNKAAIKNGKLIDMHYYELIHSTAI